MICRDSSCLLHSFKTSSLKFFFTVLAWFSGIEDKTNADKFDIHLGLDTTNGQWWLTGCILLFPLLTGGLFHS